MKQIILLFLLTPIFIFGQDYSNRFYPLALGNKWVYESSGHWTEIKEDSSIWVYSWSSPLSVEVIDTVSSNEKIFKLLITRENIFNNRIEKMTWYETFYEDCEVYSSYELLFLFNGYQKRIDLCSVPGDSTQFKFFDYRFKNQPVILYHSVDSTISPFGESIAVHIFERTTEKEFYNLKLAQGFGLTEQHGGATDDDWSSHLALKGAMIDGVVYGDTSLIVSVETKEDLQNKFYLFQNYPNPFNPTTTIMFKIPTVETRHAPSLQTSLIVYDILGREIKTLIYKQLQPGEYKVKFDASGLPSGVYYYRLKVGQFVQSRKMLLLR